MAGGFLRALAKMKLVELDEDAARPPVAPDKKSGAPEPSAVDLAEVDRILAEEDARAKAKAPPRAAPPRTPPTQRAAPPSRGAPPSQGAATSPAKAPPVQAAPGPAGIAEGRPLGEYYAEAGVPDSPFPAEKLLRVLDGLKALDPGTRKAAVMAMDAADDAWAIADVVLDAQRKLRVLTDSLQRLEEQVGAVSAHVSSEKQKLDAYLTEATGTIHKKIGDLERLLQEETAQVVTQQAQLDGQVEAVGAASIREGARLREEMRRLHELCTAFSVERGGA